MLKGVLQVEMWLITYKEFSIRLKACFSLETMEARKQWYDIFKLLKRKPSTKNSISSKLSFKNGEIKTSPDKQNLKKFITVRPALQEMLKVVLQVKMKGH